MRAHSKFLIELLQNRSPKYGAEIGVFEGDNSLALLSNLDSLHLLVCVDPFLHYPEFDKATPNKRGKVFNADFQKVKYTFYSKLLPYYRRFILEETYSEFAAPQYPNDFFDFVFIDGNHSYEYVFRDIVLWLPKIKNGGIICGHDYVNKPGYGVIKAVNELFGEEVGIDKKSKVWYNEVCTEEEKTQ